MEQNLEEVSGGMWDNEAAWWVALMAVDWAVQLAVLMVDQLAARWAVC